MPHGTARQPQGSHSGGPWDLQGAPRSPRAAPSCISGSPNLGVSPGSPSPGLRIRALDHEEGIRVSDPGSPASGLRIRASETECLILGVKFWQSESGSSNLGVRFWESDHRSPSLGVGSPITGVNLGGRSWASDPRKPSSGVQIEKILYLTCLGSRAGVIL